MNKSFDKVKAWPWMATWCRKNGFSPFNQYWWKQAEIAYKKENRDND